MKQAHLTPVMLRLLAQFVQGLCSGFGHCLLQRLSASSMGVRQSLAQNFFATADLNR